MTKDVAKTTSGKNIVGAKKSIHDVFCENVYFSEEELLKIVLNHYDKSNINLILYMRNYVLLQSYNIYFIYY